MFDLLASKSDKMDLRLVEKLLDYSSLKPIIELDKNKQWFIDMVKLVRKFLISLTKLLSMNIDD